MKKLIAGIIAHKILSTILGVLVLGFLVLCGLRYYNKNIKPEKEKVEKKVEEVTDAVSGVATAVDNIVEEGEQTLDDLTSDSTQTNEPLTDVDAPTDEVTKKEGPKEDYDSELTIDARAEHQKEAEETARKLKLEADRQAAEEKARLDEAIKNQKPTYGDEVLCWDKDGVPKTMVDGSSCKEYYHSVALSDFGSKWGGPLTKRDRTTKKLILVGVDQNPDDIRTGYDEESTGWLIDHLDTISDDTCIKFTDLNIIGKLAKKHVAVLCSYDWYSAYGMKDTMVVFEDTTGTLKPSKFKSGTVFSAHIYRHNIKVKKVNGQRVVCLQYVKFE